MCVFHIYFLSFVHANRGTSFSIFEMLSTLSDKVVKWVRVNSKGHVFKELKFHWTAKLWDENF